MVEQNKWVSKLPAVGTTIFTVMSKLAADVGALNLSQGFPNFSGDERLVELVHNYMQQGFNQYAPMAGVPLLQTRIAEKVERLYGVQLDAAAKITITTGGSQAIYTALATFLQAGEEVVVFEPCYDSYVPGIQLHGGKVVPVVLRPPDYRIPWDEVQKVVNEKTRFVIINTPHNPTGMVWTAEDMQQLIALSQRYGFFVLSDEVYEHLIFDGRQHESVLRYPELRDRSFVIYSFGKTFHITGWKVGYCIAPAALTAEFRKVHQFLVFSVNTPLNMPWPTT